MPLVPFIAEPALVLALGQVRVRGLAPVQVLVQVPVRELGLEQVRVPERQQAPVQVLTPGPELEQGLGLARVQDPVVLSLFRVLPFPAELLPAIPFLPKAFGRADSVSPAAVPEYRNHDHLSDWHYSFGVTYWSFAAFPRGFPEYGG